jgi:hypothetical protein
MKTVIAALFCVLISAGTACAEPVGNVVAVRGSATVERGGKKLDAQPRLGIDLQDTVVTGAGGRVKLLFIDDSVLTLAEKTHMNIDTFLHSRTDRGKSLFNLLDGKMRAVVGKTGFEVKTPTVVAAARGTVILFEVGKREGRHFTRVTSLEGLVDVRSLIEGTEPVLLSPGQSILVMAGEPLPAPTQLTPAEREELMRETSTSGSEITHPKVRPRETMLRNFGRITPIPVVSDFDQMQPPQPKPRSVTIGVNF